MTMILLLYFVMYAATFLLNVHFLRKATDIHISDLILIAILSSYGFGTILITLFIGVLSENLSDAVILDRKHKKVKNDGKEE